jgi:hypothetical protein
MKWFKKKEKTCLNCVHCTMHQLAPTLTSDKKVINYKKTIYCNRGRMELTDTKTCPLFSYNKYKPSISRLLPPPKKTI